MSLSAQVQSALATSDPYYFRSLKLQTETITTTSMISFIIDLATSGNLLLQTHVGRPGTVEVARVVSGLQMVPLYSFSFDICT